MPDQHPRKVLITGVSHLFGLRLAKRLEADDDVGSVIGVDLQEPAIPMKKLDFVRADIRSPLIARVLESTEVDTIVHTNITSSPRTFGGRSGMKENNVLGTLQLLAAAQRAQRVKKVVMRSSAAVYGSEPGEPSIIPEDHAGKAVHLTGYAKDCAEAETYARDFGRRRPDVELVILRTQNVAGPTVRTSITDYLSLPIVPSALGFDPRLQLLHEEDAVDALYLALTGDQRGIFNIAAEGVVYLSQATRLLRRPELPLVPFTARFAAGLLRRFGIIDFPTDQLKLLLYGRVLDIRRAREQLGFTPRYTTKQTLLDFRDHRSVEDVTGDPSRPTWERDLKRLAAERPTGETV
ncbi:MAG: NAD-dependent epimerase/dehydratase family protein [Actinobacteria bacterium]|nr:NAD-dependent epimerase/dehydratase family protein [Actinomycetota bacterium]